MAWSVAGLILSLLLAGFAFVRSRAAGGFYDAGVYGMTSSAHRRAAITASCFALGFAATWAFAAPGAAFWIFAAFIVGAVTYLSSFLRGFTEDDD
jgi:hypothetical protein